MDTKTQQNTEENYQVCTHCGKTFPKHVNTCPFCHKKVTLVEQTGNKLAYARLALIAAIIAAGFLFKCAHDHHQAQQAEQQDAQQEQLKK